MDAPERSHHPSQRGVLEHGEAVHCASRCSRKPLRRGIFSLPKAHLAELLDLTKFAALPKQPSLPQQEASLHSIETSKLAKKLSEGNGNEHLSTMDESATDSDLTQ